VRYRSIFVRCAFFQGVFDRQLVQAELAPDDVELFAAGFTEIEPDRTAVTPVQLVRDLVRREVLFDQLAVAVQTGADGPLVWWSGRRGRRSVRDVAQSGVHRQADRALIRIHDASAPTG